MGRVECKMLLAKHSCRMPRWSMEDYRTLNAALIIGIAAHDAVVMVMKDGPIKAYDCRDSR